MFNLLKLYMIIFKSTVYILTSKKKKKEKRKSQTKTKPQLSAGQQETNAVFLFPIEYNTITLIRHSWYIVSA